MAKVRVKVRDRDRVKVRVTVTDRELDRGHVLDFVDAQPRERWAAPLRV